MAIGTSDVVMIPSPISLRLTITSSSSSVKLNSTTLGIPLTSTVKLPFLIGWLIKLLTFTPNVTFPTVLLITLATVLDSCFKSVKVLVVEPG